MLLHVIEMKDQALIFTKSAGMYSRDSRRTDVFHASVLETAFHVWIKDLT